MDLQPTPGNEIKGPASLGRASRTPAWRHILFEADVDARDSEVVLRLSGELDFAVISTARDALRYADVVGGSMVTVDVDGLDFIDASGIAMINEFASERTGEGLTVTGRHGQVAMMLRRTGVEHRLNNGD